MMLNYMIFTLQANFLKTSSSEYGTTQSKEKKKKEKKIENILIKVIYQISFQNECVKWFVNLKLITLFQNDI